MTSQLTDIDIFSVKLKVLAGLVEDLVRPQDLLFSTWFQVVLEGGTFSL